MYVYLSLIDWPSSIAKNHSRNYINFYVPQQKYYQQRALPFHLYRMKPERCQSVPLVLFLFPFFCYVQSSLILPIILSLIPMVFTIQTQIHSNQLKTRPFRFLIITFNKPTSILLKSHTLCPSHPPCPICLDRVHDID